LSAAFCDTHFRGMEQKAHSIVLPSVVLKGRYYMTQGQDLLTGSVPKKLIRFAFPLFLANLLQALYNVVDMLVVGKIVGKTGLAAISNASMLCFIINSLCIGLTMGGSVLVAQCKGANDQTGQRDTIGMLFFLSLVGSAVVTILGLAIYEALFQALNVPANAYQDACGYMKIICCGTVFVFGYNAVCSILKGLGDSQTPLFFVGVATVLNVVLDVLLVGPLSMGTAGAAWATITAQGVSFMGSLVYLRRYQPGFSLRKIEFHREKLLAILKVGLPTAIQMVVVNTAYLLVTGMLNQFGTPVAAASGVGLKINTFAGMHCWAIGQAITAMVGQCLGAGQIERARKVVRSGLLLNLSVTAAVAVVVQLLAEPLICMFDGTSPEVIRCGVQYLRTCCSINSLIYAAMYTLDSFAIGVGAAHVAMVNAFGAAAAPMGFGEVYTAIQQGVIDGAENNELALTNNKHGEVAKYYSYNKHQMVPDMLVANLKFLNGLSPEEYQVFKDAAALSTEVELEEWDKSIEEAKDIAQNKMGVEFIDVDVDAFKQKVLPLHETMLKDNPKIVDLYNHIQEINEKAKGGKQDGDNA
jgi:putative MATE family efflux protein